MKSARIATLWLLTMGLSTGTARAEYDPLRIASAKPEHVDLTVKDGKRSREIPVRVYLPAGKQPAPVVLFSHGLGGARTNSAYLGNHWAARGYVVVFMQHAGSDESVWKDAPLAQRMAAMRQAASARNFQLRVQDVPAVLDQLHGWNAAASHPLAGRMNLQRVGMSGHSFGAVTTQAVSGQSFPLGRSFTDPRITAAVLMSPSSPRRGDAGVAFGKVKIPWLLMTGTHDTAVIGDADVASRLAVFPALPAGDKYELVFEKGEHSAFSDRSLPGDTLKRNPNHHRAILALTTAFWDAYLREETPAKDWLQCDKARGVLESADKWQKK